MKKLKLVIAYDGQPYDGWQSQASGNAIQDHLGAAVQRICKQRVSLYGAGRTDAGVHAAGQVVHLDVPAGSRMEPADWVRALNSYLPPAIRVLKAAFVPEAFHARFSACGKHYRYQIDNGPILSPWDVGRVWHVPLPLDRDLLQAVSALYVGTKDFRSFAANRGKTVPDTVRTITRAEWRGGKTLTFDVEGDGFLYKMVRLLVGTAVRVALGKAELSWVEGLLAHPAMGKNSQVAPADGLYLVKVGYPASAA